MSLRIWPCLLMGWSTHGGDNHQATESDSGRTSIYTSSGKRPKKRYKIAKNATKIRYFQNSSGSSAHFLCQTVRALNCSVISVIIVTIDVIEGLCSVVRMNIRCYLLQRHLLEMPLITFPSPLPCNIFIWMYPSSRLTQRETNTSYSSHF